MTAVCGTLGRVSMNDNEYMRRVRAIEGRLYRVAQAMLWRQADSMDAVQEAVFRGWLKKDSLADDERLEPWLVRILVNQCRDMLRKRKRDPAALLTEMLAVTGKSISALYREITDQYGELCYREADFRMTPERKAELQKLLFEEKLLPDFASVERINREDGVKCYFADGSWVICRFSGTEPLLRMASEAETGEKAESLIGKWRELLSL